MSVVSNLNFDGRDCEYMASETSCRSPLSHLQSVLLNPPEFHESIFILSIM